MSESDAVSFNFRKLYSVIPELMGLDESFLRSVLNSRLEKLNLESLDQYLRYYSLNNREKQIIIDETRNSHSEFFRETFVFEYLSRYISRQLTSPGFLNKSSKEYRIWSMACSSGQEPFSLAILLEEIMVKNEANALNFRIFATDFNEKRIQDANRGVYFSSTLANVKHGQLSKWFLNKGSFYEINQNLKQKVEFSVFDLLNPELSYPSGCVFGDFHLVFCANVLYYYAKQQQEEILRKAIRSLTKGGILVVSETERELIPEQNFRELIPESGIFELK